MTKKKPEILAPAGNIESFYAAINAGADAIYLGLQEFNARGRASNFSKPLLRLAIGKAHEKRIKVYITLNILIKNKEINQFIDTLSFLQAIKVDGVIIQDWGVFYLIRNYFPGLTIHASTQMGNHNSIGVNFGSSKGISRTVLARELTMPEMEAIASHSKSELEVFVHGALCYSFSGMCLFSSYAGGQGANRGICKQSCRRIYQDSGNKHALFSLKDNLQINNLQKLIELGIHSLKIEGRMKSADYVYQVCSAYRQAVDSPGNMGKAVQLLEMDLGREKTGYFLGGNISDGITYDPTIGKLIGRITELGKHTITFKSSVELAEGYRIRIRKENDDEQLYITIEKFSNKDSVYQVSTDLTNKVSIGNDVILVRTKSKSFASRLGNINTLPELRLPKINQNDIRNSLKIKSEVGVPKSMLYVRIGSPEWLVKLRFEDYDAIILSYKRSDWDQFDVNLPILVQNKKKIRIELPKFISELQLDYYKNLTKNLSESGYNHFFISHLSQLSILTIGSIASCNENVYVLNDAAAKLLNHEKVKDFTYPLENDIENLTSMTNKQGIVPLYFYPELFYSRMPVKLEQENKLFADETNKKFRLAVKDGITLVYPTIPVALFHYRRQLEKSGFSRFLIDYSGEMLSANVVKRILKKYLDNESIHPASNFNFKLGLK
jgi:U32 family peptidase